MIKIMVSVLVSLLLGGVVTASLPDSITVTKESGITMRSDFELGNAVIGQVYQNYSYDVIAGRPSYYQVKLQDDQIGWVYANTEKQWTVFDNNQVTVLYAPGLNVRAEAYNSDSPIIGYVKQGEIYDVLDIYYSYLKVSAPGRKQGWIYAGKPNDMWVSFQQNSVKQVYTDSNNTEAVAISDCPEPVVKEKIVYKTAPQQKQVVVNNFDSKSVKYNTTFIGGDIKGDFTVKTSGLDSNRDNQFNSYRFLKPGSSYVELSVDLKSLDYSTLVLEHNVDTNLADKDSVAYISMTVNDKLVVRGMSVSADGFRNFMMSVKNYLKKGSNKIRIDYLRGSKSDYWLRSISLK